MAIYFLTFICMTNVQVSLALLADARLGWTATEVGHLFGLYGLMALLVQGGAIGKLSRRFPSVNVLVGGTIAIGLGMAAIGAAYSPALLLIGVALAGLGAGLTNPTLASLASQHAGVAQQGAVLGFAQSAGGAARTVGPVWSGFLYARLGAAAPFVSGVHRRDAVARGRVALRRRTLARAAASPRRPWWHRHERATGSPGKAARSSAAWHGEGGDTLLALTHGAGGTFETPSLVAYAEAMAARGMQVVRFNLPYVEAGKKTPGPQARDEACWRDVAEALRPRGRAPAARRSLVRRPHGVARGRGRRRVRRARAARLPAPSARQARAPARRPPRTHHGADALPPGHARPLRRPDAARPHARPAPRRDPPSPRRRRPRPQGRAAAPSPTSPPSSPTPPSHWLDTQVGR